MRYLATRDIELIPTDWEEFIAEINKASLIFRKGNYSQPIKPYLRYNNPENRIIAMPAYIGENIGVAGIKWIASFPSNLEKNLKRAHSTIILNDEASGVPFAILNTALVSCIRTAAVTGSVIKKYLAIKDSGRAADLTVGLTGFGPIGRMHQEMIEKVIGENVRQYLIYDVRRDVRDHLHSSLRHKTSFVEHWREAFDPADLFCTCTVSKCPYIDRAPKPGSLHLNVSLRDYKTSFMDSVDLMVVDDWKEVCRENTDIERMHLEKGLNEAHTINLSQFLCDFHAPGTDDVVMFNPMGMAIYDLAIAKHFYDRAVALNIGLELAE